MSVFTNSSTGAAGQAGAYVSAVLGLLGNQDPITVLRDTPAALRRAIDGVPLAKLRQAETSGKWSINQVLQHLADSDLVWGWRVRLILAQDRPAITGYDQDQWADRLHYDDADPEVALETFAVLRRGNLRLIERAPREDWARVGVHAERGEESIAHLIDLYAGHDLLHLQQIARVRGAVMAR
jgi:uncharacterized damage-inducible protein DinB